MKYKKKTGDYDPISSLYILCKARGLSHEESVNKIIRTAKHFKVSEKEVLDRLKTMGDIQCA